MNAIPKAFTSTPGQIELIARDSWAKARGDINKAAQLIVAAIAGDASMLQALALSYLQHVDFERIDRKHSRESIVRSINNANAPSAQDHARRVVALARSNVEMLLLDFALIGGKKLRDGTKKDLRDSAERYYAQGSDMTHKGRWLALVAAKVPEGNKAGDVLKEEELRKLFEAARHAKKN